jgi:hypothetical protein
MTSFGRVNHCLNLNHRRANSPVGHCPDCGAVVNQQFHRTSCTDAEHSDARRRRLVFCVHCGVRLVSGASAFTNRYESD